MVSGSRQARHWLVAGTVLIGTAEPATAQALPEQLTRDAERIETQQQWQALDQKRGFESRQQRAPSGIEPQMEALSQAPDAESCAAIRAVVIVGVTQFDRTEFADVETSLKGECVTVNSINAALRAITNRYVARGYVTSRAFVGPQDLKEGALTITVIEGRVDKLIGKGASLYRRSELAAAFPVSNGSMLNLRALEQGVDQLARLASTDPSIEIAPGDMPASSTVLVTRKPQLAWLRPAVTVTNDGAASTGRLLGTVSLDADSPLRLADLWSLYFSRDLGGDPSQGNHAWGGFMSLPHGWWTLSLSGGKSAYRSVLRGNGLAFVSKGESWNAGATLDRMIHRNSRTKLSVSAGLSLLDTANFIQGIQLRTGSYRIVSARADAHWQRRIDASLLSANIGYVRGLGILGAHSADTGPGGPTGRFNLIAVDAAWQSRFALGPTSLTHALALRGQWGLDNLFPAQRFSLGGTSTVRGFRDDGISGRTGFTLREQLAVGITRLARNNPRMATAIAGLVAYDLGGIRASPYSSYERGIMQSASVGIRAQQRHLDANFAFSVPITAPSWVRHKATEISAAVRILL